MSAPADSSAVQGIAGLMLALLLGALFSGAVYAMRPDPAAQARLHDLTCSATRWDAAWQCYVDGSPDGMCLEAAAEQLQDVCP